MQEDYKPRIENLLSVLSAAFSSFNQEKISSCYSLPCMLNWDGKTSILNDRETIGKQFESIWAALRLAKFNNFHCHKASLQKLSGNQAMACVQWILKNYDNQPIKRLSSTYLLHFTTFGSGWKIVADVVHDFDGYVKLPEPLQIHT